MKNEALDLMIAEITAGRPVTQQDATRLIAEVHRLERDLSFAERRAEVVGSGDKPVDLARRLVSLLQK